ncbi:MAG: sigma-70 family RNA polymerase sigma factor [Thermoleophilia bacterium]
MSAGGSADLVAAARAGDEDAFARLVAPHRGELHALCYRMLGSVHDAEDAVQESLLRAWRGLGRFEQRSSPRRWLHTITTNVCLDAIAARRRRIRVLPQGSGTPPTAPDAPLGEPLPATTWIEPYPDGPLDVPDGRATPEARYEHRESLELAFVAALQHLPPRQRAVLILREVLGFSAAEVAEALDTSVASVNSLLQRARRSADERLPERSQQATLRALGDDGLRDLVRRFADAFESGDLEAILALLSDDVVFAMPPWGEWYRGRDAVGDSWLMPGGPPPRLRYVPTTANGQIALGTYAIDAAAGAYLPIALDVLTLDETGDGIREVFAFRDTALFPAFGLPASVPA